MGVNDREQNRKDSKRQVSAVERRRRATNPTGASTADWGAVDGVLLARAIGAVSKRGGAIRFGYTRDGGAYAVGFYGDGDPFTEYIPPSDDIEAWLKGVIEDYG